jgi:hypothetical protein
MITFECHSKREDKLYYQSRASNISVEPENHQVYKEKSDYFLYQSGTGAKEVLVDSVDNGHFLSKYSVLR